MKASRRTLIAVVLLIVTLGQIASVQAAGDWRFGVVEAYEAPISAWDLGVTWTRVRFQWSEVQADGPDAWAPEVSDELIEQELAAGRTVVGLLIGIPDWARDANKLPMGLSLPPDDPDNTWASFVREAVTRYDGRINHWIIWNEPDIDPTAIAHTWDGSVDDFYQLQRTAYLVAKAANPSAVIHLAAFTYWADVNAGREQYMARLLDRILQDPDAAANQYYFDIATAHLYFQSDQIYDLVRFFIGLMEERGMRKPLWLVETNAPPADDPDWQVDDWTLYVTQNEQAAFIPQGLAAALAAGAERVAIYKLQDTADDRAANPEPFGLVRTDGSRRPAFRTYKTAVAYMSGAFHIERERWDEVGQFRLDQADRTTTVLFARLPQSQTVRVPAQSATARLVNMWGEIEVVAAEGGAFQVELPGALCIQTIGDYCMIGGTTYYLVQALEGGEPPDFAPPTLPPPSITPTPAPTLTPTPTATPTQTPSPTATPLPSATPTAASTSTATPTPEVLAGERAGEAGGTAVPINPNSSQNSTAQTLPGGYIILGGAALLAVGLGGWRFVRRRRYQQGSKRRSR